MGVIEDLASARAAYERRDWVRAYDVLSDADDGALAADDFTRLANAAILVGRRNDYVQAMQRAYQAHLDAGNLAGAARSAAELAVELLNGGEFAIAQGWSNRCRHALDAIGEEVVEEGYHLQVQLFEHIYSGGRGGLVELAARIVEVGRRFDDPDLVANGLNAQGRMMIYGGQVREGLALLDESMLAVSLGEVSTVVAGHVYCSLVEACQELADYGRAAEWTSALSRWVDEQPGLVAFTGQCAVHRGQILKVRGELGAAVEEFERAVERYLSTGQEASAGLAIAEWGDVLRIRGQLATAEETFDRAVALGHECQPGLALLWLARGRRDAAAAAVRRLLDEPRNPVARARLLPSAAELLLAVDELDEAERVVDELRTTSDDFGCRPLRAMAAHANGALRLARDDPAGALPSLREAAAHWQAIEAPYELARTRELVGVALRRLGDEQSASTESQAARAAFERLGAEPDARRVAGPDDRRLPGGLTEREAEVLRLVARGSSNPEIARALVLSEKTVARHLSNIFGKLDVSSRTAAAAYAFDHRLV